MGRAAVVDIDLGYNKIIEDLLKTEKYTLLVGVQEGSITRGQNKNGIQQPVGVNIAQYAAQNEFGTNIIPERSFMRTAVDENIQYIQEGLSRQLGQVIDENKTLLQAFNITGLAITDLVKKKIVQIRIPPNAPYTIAKKKSSKPLIDFGALLASIRHTVRKR